MKPLFCQECKSYAMCEECDSEPELRAYNQWQAYHEQELAKEWISCKDRLPEYDVPVMAAFGSGGDFSLEPMMVSFTDDGYYWCEYEGYGDISDKNNYVAEDDYDVDYWQPLPKPPKGEV